MGLTLLVKFAINITCNGLEPNIETLLDTRTNAKGVKNVPTLHALTFSTTKQRRLNISMPVESVTQFSQFEDFLLNLPCVE